MFSVLITHDKTHQQKTNRNRPGRIIAQSVGLHSEPEPKIKILNVHLDKFSFKRSCCTLLITKTIQCLTVQDECWTLYTVIVNKKQILW